MGCVTVSPLGMGSGMFEFSSIICGVGLDLGVTEVSKIDSTWDKSDSKSTSSRLRESLELKLKLD